MGGQILDYEVKRVRNAAIKEAQEEAAYNLFKNGVNFELVRASIKGLTDEELQAIYEEAVGNENDDFAENNHNKNDDFAK